MGLVAGLDVAERSVAAWVGDSDDPSVLLATASSPVVGSEPAAWERACRTVLADAVAAAGRPGRGYLGLTVTSSLRAVVTLGAAGVPLGNVLHLGDADALAALLALRAGEPARWAACTRLVLLADWVLAGLTGVEVTGAAVAGELGLLEPGTGGWAPRLEAGGLDPALLPPLAGTGALVGELVGAWPLPATLPVVLGGPAWVLAAVGAGGLGDGVVTVVAGPPDAVQLATTTPRSWPGARAVPHATAGLWAVEAVRTEHPEGDLHRAYAVRRDLERLERAHGRTAQALVVCGAVPSSPFVHLLAEVLGRDLCCAGAGPVVAVAGTALTARAVGAHAHLPALPRLVVPGGDPAPHDEARARWLAAHG